MQQMQHEQQQWVEAVLPAERAKLVRLCAYLTGDPSAAEDIAQEAMIEAWRTADRITDQAASSTWLTGCARNSCKRWARRRGRTLAHELPLEETETAGQALSTTIDLERDLERDELIELLDRALALLPPDTRDALIQHYVDELPQAAIADRLGATEGAVAVRIHRGKIAMRKALSAPELQSSSRSYGITIADAYWQESRIWCPHCGTNRLVVHLSPGNEIFEAMCPGCDTHPGFFSIPREDVSHILGGITSFKPAFTRYTAWIHRHFSQALIDRTARCVICGNEAPLRLGLSPQTTPPRRGRPGIHYYCEHCDQACDIALSALAFWLPEGRQFQRAHPRTRLLPYREIEADGVPAIVTTFESLDAQARFAVVSARDTLIPLGVHREPEA